MTTKMIKGRKGGSTSAHTPVESPDSIQSIARAKILVALGEGEIAGGLDGTNIFLGDGSTTTPLANADGSLNFSGVSWDFRPGTQSQTFIPGMPDVENEIAVGVTLSSASPWVRAISNTELTAVRIRLGFPTMEQQQSNGDETGYRVEYAIDLATDGGAYQQVLDTAVDGKTTTTYERSHRIDLPAATTGWQIRIRRITPDSTTQTIVDPMNIEAITEVIDAKLRYPNTALLYVEFDAQQFPNYIPKVSCKPKGRIIRVPDTYDPVARTYSGTWTGGFKWAYSNNPAWVFYDIVLSDMFGLGNRIDSTEIDEGALYQIAQYCDQLVPDGLGGNGTEPRFLCDIYIQSQEDAWTVLTDLAGIFRGMTYWGQDQLVTLADMPRDIDYTITRANVVNGKFTYSSSSEKTHYTTAMVSYSDPDNHYADIVEPVFENSLVQRYGVNQTEITAIGCTRRSEANRRGRWALLSNVNDRVVDFSMGLDGIIPIPGRIIGIANQNLAGKVTGGRVSAVSGRNITLDRVADVAAGDRLIINLPSGVTQARTVQTVNGKIVTVTTTYSETPVAQAVWAVDSDNLAIHLFRVSRVADNGDNTYAVTATQYDPSKYAAIDTGARLDVRPISIIPPRVQPPPTNVSINSYTAISQGLAVTTLRVTWEKAASAIAYEAEWRKDNGNWISAARTSALGFEVTGIYAGAYQARVRAINASEISSIWANADETQLTGKVGNPPKPVGFTASTYVVFGIRLTWAFPDGAEDTLKTEIQYSSYADGTGALLLSDVPYPQKSYQQMGLAAGVTFWYRAQLVDKTGNESGYTDWIMGASSSDASEVLSYLTGQITATQLGQDLLGPVQDASQLKNMWSVKVGQTSDGKLYTAGIGVGVENTPEGMQSQVLILADRFAVLNLANNVVSTPFAIDGGQVFMNIAFIKDGTITNAKIGDYIQSNNFVSGSVGWHIGKDGSSEFQNGTYRGNIIADTGTLNNVTINDSCIIKGTLTANQVRGGLASNSFLDLSGVSDPNGNATHVQNFSRMIEANSYVNRTCIIVGPMRISAANNGTGSLKVEIFANNSIIGTATISSTQVNEDYFDASGAFGAFVSVPINTQVEIRIQVTKINRGIMLAGPALANTSVDFGLDWSAQY